MSSDEGELACYESAGKVALQPFGSLESVEYLLRETAKSCVAVAGSYEVIAARLGRELKIDESTTGHLLQAKRDRERLVELIIAWADAVTELRQMTPAEAKTAGIEVPADADLDRPFIAPVTPQAAVRVGALAQVRLGRNLHRGRRVVHACVNESQQMARMWTRLEGWLLDERRPLMVREPAGPVRRAQWSVTHALADCLNSFDVLVRLPHRTPDEQQERRAGDRPS